MDDPFFITIPRGLSLLYREGKTGHWGDIRTTAEAMLALLGGGESTQSPHIQCASDFLIANFKSELSGGSWGSEVWDTALAIRALYRVEPKGHGAIQRAFQWIYTKQLADGSFDGEPWDSLFVCQAALEAGQPENVFRTIEWLISLQTPNGVVISGHYSGLFCQVLGRSLDLELPSALRHKVREAAIKTLQFLWDGYSSGSLWGEGTWTNAYIVSGMLALRHPQVLAKYDEILSWYASRQSQSGAWDDTVRTAIALQALLALRLSYELEKSNRTSLKTLTEEFLVRSTEADLFKRINSKTDKTPVVRTKKLIDHDDSGNRIITLTPERQLYIGVIVSVLGMLWALVRNWDFIKRIIFH